VRAKYVPPEFTCYTDDDTPVIVRYDYDEGEEQWFDARAGVGSPGYPGGVFITEVKIGDGIWTDELDQFDADWLARIEAQIEEKITAESQEHWEP
jgi:hypothetical protein